MTVLGKRLVGACAVGGVDGGMAVGGGEVVPEGAELGGESIILVRMVSRYGI